jgi:hypothetical protein
MGPHRKLGIYVGFQSTSILKYMDPLTGDLFAAQIADCILKKGSFSSFRGR